MTSSTPRRFFPPKRFWTARRLMTTFIALVLLATVSLSSCTQPENVSTTNSNATAANPATGNAAPRRSTTAPGSNGGAPATTNGAAPPTNSGPPNTNLLTPLPAPILDAQLKTIEGKPFKLSDSKGKVLVLDLWATWCGPCRQEVPHLVELQKELGPRGVEVFGLDIDPLQDTPEDVLAFMKEFKVNYKVAFLERQYAAMLMSDNGSIPQSYVITHDGKIHSRFIGFSASTTAPRIRAAIEEALKMK